MNERSDRSDLFDSVERIIEDYDLEHGNGEVFVQDGQLYVTVEAPNHATIGEQRPLIASSGGITGDGRGHGRVRRSREVHGILVL